MGDFAIEDLPLSGLRRVTRQRKGDARGFLARIYCAEQLAAAGFVKPVAQINHTMTAERGTLRGMHFQRAPHAEMKLVSCLRGEVFDVAIDLRQGSPSFLKWHGETLSAENGVAFLIPEGFAHGFQALSDDVELIYCHSASYHPASEGGLDALDQRLNIAWPLPVSQRSARDAAHAPLAADFKGLSL